MKNLFLIITFILLVGCNKKTDDPLKQITEVDISVPTVICDQCETAVKKAAFALSGVKAVNVDLEKKSVHIKFVAFQTNQETIEMAIADAGYDAGSHKRNPEAYANLPACCKKD